MHDSHAACSSSCAYRSLYEGTQASLTDMAARQSQALGRVGRLRSAVISAMKAARPGRFAEIEQRSKLRVQDGDDLFVVAVLEHILREQPADARGENLVELREALRPWGIELVGEDMAAWVHQLRNQTPRQVQSKSSVERAATVSFAQAARARQEQSTSSWESAAKLGVSELVQRIAVSDSESGTNSWMDLSQAPDAPSGAEKPGRVVPPTAESAPHLDVDELFAPSATRETQGGATTPPTAAMQDVETATDPAINDGVERAETLETPNPPEGELVEGATDESVDDDDIFSVVDDVIEDGPADDFGAIGGDSGDDPFDDAFDEEEPEPGMESTETLTEPEAAAEREELGAEAPETAPTTGRATTLDASPLAAVPQEAASDTERGPAAPLGAGWVDVFPASDAQAARETPAPAAPVAVTETAPVAVPTTEKGTPSANAAAQANESSDRQVDEKPRRKVAPSAPVRVELFPHTTPQRPSGTRKRKPKKSALPPEAFSADGIVQSGLSDKARAQLLSMCMTPRPVFSGDLADLVGDVSIVEEWQEETYANGSMRFIDAKTRHRQLGSLAIPHGDTRKMAEELSKSWWGAAMERYRGAKLYELGVVGRKLGTTICSWHVDPVHPVVSLRANAERGLQGVIVVCDDELEDGGMGRRGVVSEIETMMREPLEIMYVLATGDRTLDPLVSAVEEEARRRGWKSPCSVVCARSWEWTDGSGPLIAVL